MSFRQYKEKIWHTLKESWKRESCSFRLSRSLSVGLFIAFSPFIGCHTIMAFTLAWILRLNGPFIFALAHLIHNPLTALPIYAADHAFGSLILYAFGINGMCYNPAWMNWIITHITSHVGIENLSLWAFLIGGNLLGLIVSVMLYPLIRYILLQRKNIPTPPSRDENS